MTALSKVFKANSESHTKVMSMIDLIDMRFESIEARYIPKEEWENLPDFMVECGNIRAKSIGFSIKEDNVIIAVEYEKGSVMKKHSHPYQEEIITIIEGFIKERITGKTAKSGQTLHFKKEEIHYIEAKEHTFMIVHCKISK